MSEQQSTNSKLLLALFVIGAAGVVATYFIAGGPRFWSNWLLWFSFMVCLSLGALFVVALHHAVGARWSVPIRRAPERVAAVTPWLVPVALVAILSLFPTLSSGHVMFTWTAPHVTNRAIKLKSAWLNYPFFLIRLAICLGIWWLSYRILVKGSLRQDVTRDPKITVRMRRYAPVFMILLALTITNFSFDWISSMEAAWYSDMFGVYLFAGTATTGFSAAILAVIYLQRRGRLKEVTPDHLYNLGGLLFGFTIFWGYIAFSQYMLQWYANMPEEVYWFHQRTFGDMWYVFILLGIGHYIVPFIALLTQEAKGNWRRLRWVAIWVLFMQFVDLFWLISPVLGPGIHFGWPEIAFAIFFLSACGLIVRRAMAVGEDLPIGDPFLQAGLQFHL